MATSDVMVEAHLTEISDPKFLSLVGKPANKVPWKVVRSDIDPKGNNMSKPVVVRRTRRSDTTNIARMEFPSTYTDDQVNERLKDFGLTGYNVAREDGAVVASRADLQTISTDRLSTINLTADGIKAVVVRSEGEASPTNPKSALSVVSIAFRTDKFDAAKAGEWLKTNGIEAEIPSGEGDTISVTRHEVPEGEETRTIALEDGIEVVVMRSDMMDVPEGYAAVINECAYGNWGWGQLDFTVILADREFSNVADDAIYTLRSVLHNILLYSSLPIAERKLLMTNALGQFQDYLNGILDSLPKTLLVAVARSANPQRKENEMTQQTQAAQAAVPAAATADADKPVTRAELTALVADAVTAAMAARSEPAAQTAAPAVVQEAAPAQAAAPVAITRADMEDMLKSMVSPLAEQVSKLAGTAVVRSDAPDTPVQQVTQTTTDKKDPATVFRGCIPGVSRN